ncbi:MAG: asparagine synthase (glutamine-hydrolyzing) [Phycisphaeraceae bacterium]
MLAHVLHRGPDGHGISEHPHCTLIHSRLAIIDALGGAQPMHAARRDNHGPLHLVFNGEIYNHRALRQKLVKHGARFQSDHSDTEALLHGYRLFGRELPKHLRGMFAFAIWDEDNRELFLARDRVGKKPLYLRQTCDELVFASLPATLVSDPMCTPEVDPSALACFLRLGYPFEKSMIQGISEVAPGHWMTVDSHGRVQTQRYWRPPPISRTSTSIGAADSVEEVLSEAVAVRLEADVPLGCFLSGGIDSSLIAALAQRHLKETGADPLMTFSVSMDDADFDETPHARAVAEHIGSRHTQLQADPYRFFDDMAELMRVAGEPTADSGILPSYWVCKAARPHVKAALTGDGGDELFGGYNRYRAMNWLARYGGMLRWLPRWCVRSARQRSRMGDLRRLLDAAAAGSQPSHQYASMIRLFDDDQARSLMPSLAEHLSEPAVPDWPDEPDPGHAAMRWDLEHYLPFDLLRKADRSSMAVALELRCPMLDTQVLDLACHLPSSVLMPDGRPKGLLRRVAARHLPESVIHLPKRGFSIPLGRWFRVKFRERLSDFLTSSDAPTVLGLEKNEVRRYLDEHLGCKADHTHRLFALLQLYLWADWLREHRS